MHIYYKSLKSRLKWQSKKINCYKNGSEFEYFHIFCSVLWSFLGNRDIINFKGGDKMGFLPCDDEEYCLGNPQGFKQHMNLSYFAYDVLQQDMFAFGVKNISALINQIFENYYQTANASVYYHIISKKEELNTLLSDIINDNQLKKRIINKLISDEEKRISEKKETYTNGKQFKIWIKKDTSKILANCNEDKIYKKCKDYIKCVVEEYARKPYIEREKIYLSDLIEKINQAITDKKQLQVVTSNNLKFNVYPYKIMSDPLHTANYLVGFSKSDNNLDNDKIPCSFRISALKSVEIMKSRSAFLKKNEKQILEQKIKSCGVQFMIEGATEICVKLTENGVKRFHRYMHLRPNLIDRNGNKFIFNCTKAQAEYYFFKFGKDAEIISPHDLRTKVMDKYQEALDMYK